MIIALSTEHTLFKYLRSDESKDVDVLLEIFREHMWPVELMHTCKLIVPFLKVPIFFLLISNENGSLCGFFRGRKGRMAPHTAKHHQENVSSLLPFCASRLTG